MKVVACVNKIRKGDVIYVNWDALRPPSHAVDQPLKEIVFNPHTAAKSSAKTKTTNVAAVKERWEDAIVQCRNTICLGISKSEMKQHWTGSKTTAVKFRKGVGSLTKSRMESFVEKIDYTFFNGELLEYCRGTRMPIRCCVDSGRVFETNHEIIADTVSSKVVTEIGSPHMSIMEGYAPDEINANQITVYTKAFDACLPTKDLPHTFDGYLITSPFELLLHAIAHEMIHCYLNAFAKNNPENELKFEDDHGFTFCKVSKNFLGHPAGGSAAGSWAAVYTETRDLASVFNVNNHIQPYDLL